MKKETRIKFLLEEYAQCNKITVVDVLPNDL